MSEGSAGVRGAPERMLIAYSTVDGQGLKIASWLKTWFEAKGAQVVLLDIASHTTVEVGRFDRVVIGASVRYGKYRPDVYLFIRTHQAALDHVPSAFFSVNLVARKPGKDTADANPYLRVFRRNVQWMPQEIGVFAGKLDYRLYGFVDRQVIRLIMWLTHGPTQPDACVEYTDWRAVERFAQSIEALTRPSIG